MKLGQVNGGQHCINSSKICFLNMEELTDMDDQAPKELLPLNSLQMNYHKLRFLIVPIVHDLLSQI